MKFREAPQKDGTKVVWNRVRGAHVWLAGNVIMRRDDNGVVTSESGWPRRPKDPTSREAVYVWDGKRMLMTGGLRGDAPFVETWFWSPREGWTAPKVTGTPLPRKQAHAALSGDEVIVAGGLDPLSTKVRHVRVTEHLQEGARWVAFPEAYESKAHPVFQGVFADATSHAVFAIGKPWSPDGDGELRLWAYLGGGRWTPGPLLEAKKGVTLDDVDARLTFAQKGRRVVALSGDDRCYELELGEWLDTLAPRGGGTPAKIEVAAPAKPAKRPMFALTTTKKPGADRIRGPSPGAAPRCSKCTKSMAFLASFARDDERLPLSGKAKALALFVCESRVDCGTTAALLLDEAPKAVHGGRGVRFTRKMDEEGSRAASGSKLGGFPRWVQDETVPTCARCGPMAFALQLDAEDVEANFGDSGAGYVFTCPHGAKFIWQSG